MKTLYKKIKKLNRLCASLSGLVLLFVTFSIFIDVFLRYFFNRPSTWVTEVSSYLFLYIIFLGTAYALDQELHIRVSFIRDQFNPQLKRYIDLLTALFGILFCIVLLWQTSAMTWSAYKENWTSPTILGAPFDWIYIVMVFGSLLLLITFLLRTIIDFIEGSSGGNA